jgi:hypothetical protein
MTGKRYASAIWGMVGVFVGAAVVHLADAQQGTPEVVSAQKFELRDERGTLRAVLKGDERGTQLLLCDEQGDLCASFGRLKDSGLAAVTAVDDAMTAAWAVGEVERGRPVAVLYDAEGKVVWRTPFRP